MARMLRIDVDGVDGERDQLFRGMASVQLGFNDGSDDDAQANKFNANNYQGIPS